MNLPATLILQRDRSPSNSLDPRGVGIFWLPLCPALLHSVLLALEANLSSFSGWLRLVDNPFQGWTRHALLRMNGLNGQFPQPGAAIWQEHRTPDGRAYYYNAATKVTQWTKPEEMMSPAEVSLF